MFTVYSFTPQNKIILFFMINWYIILGTENSIFFSF